MINSLIRTFGTLSYIINHPLNADKKVSALKRYFFWQIGSRLALGDTIVPFVENRVLIVNNGMRGATGNIYTGLDEFEDMMFLLHLLRDGDLFVDIGSNIGSYTILASAVAGVNSISIEPIRQTFRQLKMNIHVNKVESSVDAFNIGIGKEKGILKFTTDLGTLNHVITECDSETNFIEVPIEPLNIILEDKSPSLIKIDAEGFEDNVLSGADAILCKDSLMAVIMELNDSGRRYGFDENKIHEKMLSYGFNTYSYSPLDRKLESLGNRKNNKINTIYVKEVKKVKKRLENANKYWIAQAGKRV